MREHIHEYNPCKTTELYITRLFGVGVLVEGKRGMPKVV